LSRWVADLGCWQPGSFQVGQILELAGLVDGAITVVVEAVTVGERRIAFVVDAVIWQLPAASVSAE